MLPADAVEKIKFLKKGNNTDYVAPDQRLVAWGGKSCSPSLLLSIGES